MTPVDNTETRSWATPVGALAAVGTGGVLLIAAAFLMALDGPGRVLVTLAGLLAVGICALGLRTRPRLALEAGPTLSLAGLRGTRTYLPADIVAVKLVPLRRLGRRTPMLELELRDAPDRDERLVLLGRWDLGTDPTEVYETLRAAGLGSAQG